MIVPITAFADWLDYINTAVSWFNGVNNALSWIDLSIADMAGFFADIADYIYSIFDDYLFVLKTWLMNIVYALDPIGDGIVEITEGIVGWTQTALQWFLNLLDDFLFAIKEWLINVYNAIDLLSEALPIILELAYDYFLGELDDFLVAIKTNIINVWDTLKSIVIILTAVGDYFEITTSNMFNSMFNAVNDAINDSFEYLFKPSITWSQWSVVFDNLLIPFLSSSLKLNGAPNSLIYLSYGSYLNDICFTFPSLNVLGVSTPALSLTNVCDSIQIKMRPLIDISLIISFLFVVINRLLWMIRGTYMMPEQKPASNFSWYEAFQTYNGRNK